MVRRLLLVQKILGSNPSASVLIFGLVAQLEERRFSKSECVSSILTQPGGYSIEFYYFIGFYTILVISVFFE